MSQIISAIYENGVLRPLTPLDLPNQAMVDVVVSMRAQEQPMTGKANVDWERELDALTFEGPSLPSNFSREDIYLDHD